MSVEKNETQTGDTKMTANDLYLAIRYNVWSNGETRLTLCYGFDEAGLLAGRDYTCDKVGGKRYGHWVFKPLNEEAFRKMMSVRWNGLGTLQREEVAVWDKADYEEKLATK